MLESMCFASNRWYEIPKSTHTLTHSYKSSLISSSKTIALLGLPKSHLYAMFASKHLSLISYIPSAFQKFLQTVSKWDFKLKIDINFISCNNRFVWVNDWILIQTKFIWLQFRYWTALELLCLCTCGFEFSKL